MQKTNSTTPLIEPSVAQVLAAIETSPDLTERNVVTGVLIAHHRQGTW